MAVIRRASVTVEHAMLVAIVVGVLMGMAIYGKRALCGKWREAGDAFGHGRQYEPGVTQ